MYSTVPQAVCEHTCIHVMLKYSSVAGKCPLPCMQASMYTNVCTNFQRRV